MKITLRADEGKWLTDGNNYGKIIQLANEARIEDFYEITNAEYEAIPEEKESGEEA